MRKEMNEMMMEQVNGGKSIDPVSGYKGDYQQILDTTAIIVGDWIYDVFNTSGAAGVKEAMKKKYGSNKWFVKRFPVYDANGNNIA